MVPILPGAIILAMLLSGAGWLYTTIHNGWATFLVILAMAVSAGVIPVMPSQ